MTLKYTEGFVMTMMINVKDQYVKQLETFISSLPEHAIEINTSLDAELLNRIDAYRSGNQKTVAFDSGLEAIRSKLVSNS